MSKRQATTELNHENWDEEDAPEQQEMGTFQTAPKEVLEKRVIRTAKRRNKVSNEEPQNSVFSKFGGFNKTQPSSFDFLANLTNGNKNTNGASNTSETVTSSLFSSKPALSSPSTGLFTMPTTSTPSKFNLGGTLTSTSPFGSGVKSTSTLFTSTKADSTVNESPFKTQLNTNLSDSKSANTTKTPTQQSTSIFGVPSSSTDSKPMLSSTNTTPFKMQPVSSTTTTMVQTTFGITTKPSMPAMTPEKKDEDKPNEKKMKYYSKLKGLNESVSDWITKHVAQTPLCILSPIFKDYEKYLKEIMAEYHGPDKEEANKKTEHKVPEAQTQKTPETKATTLFSASNTGASLFSSSISNTPSKPSIFGAQNNVATSAENKSFSFGIQSSTGNNNTSTTSPPSSGFSFGVKSTAATSTSFSPSTNSAPQSGSTPFSFGTGKPFSFSPTSVQPNSAEKPTADNDDDEPPKVEYTPVKEDNSVYEKKCKIFVKKGGEFIDKGVGTLYVKKVEESGKHQLFVRANTNLGTVLLNFILASAIPTQRMGKNNVMLVCIPTPESEPPPTPVLIRVKTAEEADELLESINKYKG